MSEIIHVIANISSCREEDLMVPATVEKTTLEEKIFRSKLIKTVSQDIKPESCFTDPLAIDSLKIKIKPLDLDNRIFDMVEVPWILKGTKESEIEGKDEIVRRSVRLPKEYIIEGIPEKAEAPRHGNLLRPVITQHMKKVIENEKLYCLDVVEERYVLNPESLSLNRSSENLAVISKKANVLTGTETGNAFLALPSHAQEEVVNQLCTFIEKTGLVDAHFGNLQFAVQPDTEEELQAFRKKLHSNEQITPLDLAFLGKLTVVDTELHGNDHLTPMECVRMGLVRFKQTINEAFEGNPPQALIDIIDERINKQTVDQSFEKFIHTTFQSAQTFFDATDINAEFSRSQAGLKAKQITNHKPKSLQEKVKSKLFFKTESKTLFF